MSRAQPPRQIATGRRTTRLAAWAARLWALRFGASGSERGRSETGRSETGRFGAGRAARAAVAAAAARLYRDLVLQARSQGFYRALGVPDTPEGRFEMIGLHAALILLRLRAEGAPGQALGQALFDLMVADLDQSLRELGVGDLGVGKQARRLAGQFYARLRALDDILGGGKAQRLGGSGAGGARAGAVAGRGAAATGPAAAARRATRAAARRATRGPGTRPGGSARCCAPMSGTAAARRTRCRSRRSPTICSGPRSGCATRARTGSWPGRRRLPRRQACSRGIGPGIGPRIKAMIGRSIGRATVPGIGPGIGRGSGPGIGKPIDPRGALALR